MLRISQAQLITQYKKLFFYIPRWTFSVDALRTFWIGWRTNGLPESNQLTVDIRPMFKRQPFFQFNASLFRVCGWLRHPFQSIRNSMNMHIDSDASYYVPGCVLREQPKKKQIFDLLSTARRFTRQFIPCKCVPFWDLHRVVSTDPQECLECRTNIHR